MKASVAGGGFTALAGYADIAGRAQIVRLADGGTVVEVHVEGLTPDTAYPAHLHALPCAFEGGGHYMIDPGLPGSGAANEVWPVVTSDAMGVGRVTLSTPHHVRPDGQAVVIHDPAADTAKMACADLKSYPVDTVRKTGVFSPFASAEAQDGGIGGTAKMTMSAIGTSLVVDVTGLKSGVDYVSHVHTLPCAVAGAGPHYVIDPLAAAGGAANEIWPWVAPNAQGGSSTRLESEHWSRPDAQSVVIHRVLVDGALKVACADLTRQEFEDHVISGTSTLLQAGIDKGYGNAAGTASLTRGIDGGTTVELSLVGMPADMIYSAHVHEYSCGLNSGGGHYVMDLEADPGELNELWVPVVVGPDGGGSTTKIVPHVARPEAQAIVVHDPGDGARVLCIDLG
jgi:hypothetical protein